MKRRFVLIGIPFLLAALLLFMPAALAEDVRVDVKADPSVLTEAGDVTFTFSISNNSDYELHEITIAQGGTAYPIAGGQELIVPPGQAANNIVITAQVADSQIGLPIPFTVSWRQGGEPYSQDVPVVVERAADPIISLTRTVEADSAKTGDHVKVQYLLKNDTKFDMSGITLIDEQLSDHPIYESGTILAGNATTVEHNYVMGEADVVSAPVVTYTVNGKTKVFSAVEPATIKMILPQLTLVVTPGTPALSGVPFSFELSNTGNQDMQNILIEDERGVAVNDSGFSLKAGASTTCSYTVLPVLTETVRHVRFTVKALDARGENYELTTQKEYDVYPFVDDSQIQTSFKAEIVTPWSAETGMIAVRLTLLNNSSVDLTRLRITEISLGELYSADTLPTGETVVDRELAIGSPRNLNFSAKAQDPTGTTREIGAYLLAVAYGDASAASETPAAEATASPTEISTENPFSFITSAVSKILVILGVVMGVAFVALIVLSVMEHSRTRRSRLFDDDADDDLLELHLPDSSRVEVLNAPPPERPAPQGTRRFRLEAEPGSWQAELRPPAEINRRRLASDASDARRRPPRPQAEDEMEVRAQYRQSDSQRLQRLPIFDSDEPIRGYGDAYGEEAPLREYKPVRPRRAPAAERPYPPKEVQPDSFFASAEERPFVEIEYDDEGSANVYSPKQEPYEQDAYVQPRMRVQEGVTRTGPKVITARPAPRVQPIMRQEIRHVTREERDER